MTDVIVVSGGDRIVPKVSKIGSNGGGGSSAGVKTLSIIETLSELATDKTEASRLTLPSPIRLSASSMKNQTSPMQHPGKTTTARHEQILAKKSHSSSFHLTEKKISFFLKYLFLVWTS